MITTYLRLRIERKRAAWQSSWSWRVFAVLKYVVLARLLFTAWELANGPHQIVTRVLGPLVARDAIAPAITVLGALLAHFDVALAESIPSSPFRRFWGARAWEWRRLVYPMCSSALLVTTALVTALFGVVGLAYTLLLYVVFLIAEQHPTARLPLLVAAVAAGMVAVPAVWFLPAALVTLAVFATLAAGRQTTTQRESAIVRAALPMAWQKELAFLRTFGSDQVYFAIGLVASAIAMLLVVRGEAMAARVTPVFWLVPWLAVLPFTRIVFNLFGSDVSALPRFTRAPRRAAAYVRWRLGVYRIPIYLLQAGAAVVVWPRLTTTRAHVAYMAGAVAFVELAVFCGGIYSARFVSAKDQKYRYTGQLVETNVRLTFALYAIIAFIVSASSSYGGLVALLILGAGVCAASAAFGGIAVAATLSRGRVGGSNNTAAAAT